MKMPGSKEPITVIGWVKHQSRSFLVMKTISRNLQSVNMVDNLLGQVSLVYRQQLNC